MNEQVERKRIKKIINELSQHALEGSSIQTFIQFKSNPSKELNDYMYWFRKLNELIGALKSEVEK